MRPKEILLVVLAAIVVAGIIVGCWFGYWAISKKSVQNRYDINTHTQQYQSSLVAQERDEVAGYDAAVDPAQKAQIKSTFCTMYTNLDPAPADLASAHFRICESN